MKLQNCKSIIVILALIKTDNSIYLSPNPIKGMKIVNPNYFSSKKNFEKNVNNILSLNENLVKEGWDVNFQDGPTDFKLNGNKITDNTSQKISYQGKVVKRPGSNARTTYYSYEYEEKK